MDIKLNKNIVSIGIGIWNKPLTYTDYEFNSQMEALIFMNTVVSTLDITPNLELGIERGYTAVEEYNNLDLGFDDLRD